MCLLPITYGVYYILFGTCVISKVKNEKSPPDLRGITFGPVMA